ncbi:MAG: DUF512 domain-containing protein [Eubacteriales bacterium]
MDAKRHIIHSVATGSIGEELEIEVNDVILEINGHEIEDIFDYQFYVQDEYIELLIEKPSGEQWLLEIEKDEMEDLGLEFHNGLMDEYRSCRNKCIFCFIDQLPEGMRETLYFKDDDARLSFLQGNYITLTNMSEHEIDRIIQYHLSPINISFHTTNHALRVEMLHNRFAGDVLKYVERLYDAGIHMNGQIVLCKNVNDGAELERTIQDLMEYLPLLESVSVVPVGLSKHREGLYALEAFTKEDATKVIRCIHHYQELAYAQTGNHFIHASDEWYILAECEVPAEETYDGYLQLANGVGMVRSLMEEVELALESERVQLQGMEAKELSMVCGTLVYEHMHNIIKRIQQVCPHVKIHLYPIVNHFFGEQITVTGLLTGQDIIAQLQGKPLGEKLLLSEYTLRSGENVLLDDYTVADMENTLQVRIDIVKSSGYDFIQAIMSR